MREISQTKGCSLAVGELPQGCRQCIEGRKLVLFVSGVCDQDCFYCTISHGRWQIDKGFANEREINSDADIIEEAKVSGAMGAGITGGDPTQRLERVVHYIKVLKENFGKNFHLHMYTHGIGFTKEKLKMVYDAGLDEIRFHLNKNAVVDALAIREENGRKWKVGMEVPCIPGMQKYLCGLIDFLEQAGADFINLNEMEFSERNDKRMMEQHGLRQAEGQMTAVEGSYETGQKVLEYARKNAKKLTVHFCTAGLKMNTQLKNRLINRAQNIRKPFEEITEDGFLSKGIIFGAPLSEIEKNLCALKISEKDFSIEKKKNRVEISEKLARMLSKKLKFKIALVQEYPSAEPWDFEVEPMNYKPEVEKL